MKAKGNSFTKTAVWGLMGLLILGLGGFGAVNLNGSARTVGEVGDKSISVDDYARELRRYVDYVKSAKPVAGGGEVLVPGEPEARMRGVRRKDGIPLAPDAWDAIAGAGRDLGVTPPAPLS
ncbi:MAG: hypothetical protein ABJI82_05450 [Alphaproteobacteria bacterium]